MSKISFNNTGSPFFKSLKEKVNNYFAEKNIQRTGGPRLFMKGLFIALSAVTLYIVLVFFTPITPVAVILCCLFGMNLAAIGFNIMHEGGHGSFSKYKWINDISAYSLNIMGGTIHFWKQKHNIDHHTYTNIEGMDHDIDVKFMRIHHDQPKHWYHKFQHLYWVLLYGISYMAWVLYQDFEKYFSGRMGSGGQAKKMALREHLIFWSTKATYLFVYLVLPIIVVGVAETLIGFVIAAVVCGLCISTVFQLAHVVEGTQFPGADEQTNKIPAEWVTFVKVLFPLLRYNLSLFNALPSVTFGRKRIGVLESYNSFVTRYISRSPSLS
ncbi:MAG: acyl-CoA desaturase [Sphingobacteriaceae bacterium]|nr:MAG: acyl-CoA desaturase [Sphingobacteriaceae bacterium]